MILSLDVRNKEQIYSSVKEAIECYGKIDVLIMQDLVLYGLLKLLLMSRLAVNYSVNLYAPIEITRAVLPHMRKQRSGRILQISSVGGRAGNAGLLCPTPWPGFSHPW